MAMIGPLFHCFGPFDNQFTAELEGGLLGLGRPILRQNGASLLPILNYERFTVSIDDDNDGDLFFKIVASPRPVFGLHPFFFRREEGTKTAIATSFDQQQEKATSGAIRSHGTRENFRVQPPRP